MRILNIGTGNWRWPGNPFLYWRTCPGWRPTGSRTGATASACAATPVSGPTEHDRTVARERWQLAKAQQAAARALDRRREQVRAKKFALVLELDAETQATDERIGALRAARTRADSDARLALLQRLRAQAFRWPRRCEWIRSIGWAQQGSNLRPAD